MAQIAALTGNANPNFAIGPNGATNPTLSADGSVSSAATGIKVKGNAAAAGADLFVTSSGTNEDLRLDAKGSGSVDIGTNSTGAIGLKRNTAVTGTLDVSGDMAVNTNKMTVAASSGNTAIAGTLGVTGNVAVNTDKFTVAASSGNTAIAGTLGVTGDVAVNTNKFSVTASSGNTAVAGTLGVTGDLAVNTDKFKVTASSGKVVAAGAIECQTSVKIGDVTLTEANLTALLALLT